MRKNVMFLLVAAAASVCSAQWLERQVILGDTFGGLNSSGGIVVNPISGNVYTESRPIQLFNPATLEKMRGPGVSGSVVFCPPSGKGYVLRETLLTIDAVADTVIGRTVLPFVPDVYAYDLTSNRLYLTSSEDNGLLVFNPDGDSIVKTIGVAEVGGLLWDSVWNRLYIATITEEAPWGPLRVLDCSTDTFLTDIQLGFEYWDNLVLSTVSHKLYCSGGTGKGSEVVVVNTDSLKPVGVVPGLSGTDIMVYNKVTDRLYTADGGYFYVVDCRSDTVRETREFDEDISVLVVSNLNGSVYLGSYDSALVVVMDTTDSVVGSLPLPGNATDEVEALTFSPDRNEVYGVTSGAVAFALDASADTIAGSVTYATVTAVQMIHNPAGHKLYAFCPGVGGVLVFDSTFGIPKRIPCSMTGGPQPLLNQTLNRIYVAVNSRLRVIDCNSDSLLASKVMYGIGSPIAVTVPYLNKLYVFSGIGAGDSVYAYDCLRDTVVSVFHLADYVTCAVYDPRSNRVFFACHDAPTIRALDPTTNSVVGTFDLASGSYRGQMALNLDLGRLYYADQPSNRMFTLDLLADSLIASESLPWSVGAMFLDRRLNKLYMCSQDTARVLVFDCNQGSVIDTVYAGYRYAGLLDDLNDKLYVRYGAVVDCRYDSVITRLDSISPSSMAWDPIDNRIFQATTSRLYVYRDYPYGVEEQKPERLGPMLTVLGNPVRNTVRLRLEVPPGQVGGLTLHDVAGRQVRSLPVVRTGTLSFDLRSLPAGVYFVCLGVGRTRTTNKVIVQH